MRPVARVGGLRDDGRRRRHPLPAVGADVAVADADVASRDADTPPRLLVCTRRRRKNFKLSACGKQVTRRRRSRDVRRSADVPRRALDARLAGGLCGHRLLESDSIGDDGRPAPRAVFGLIERRFRRVQICAAVAAEQRVVIRRVRQAHNPVREITARLQAHGEQPVINQGDVRVFRAGRRAKLNTDVLTHHEQIALCSAILRRIEAPRQLSHCCAVRKLGLR